MPKSPTVRLVTESRLDAPEKLVEFGIMPTAVRYVPDGTDLNTFCDIEHSGTWDMVSTYTYFNLPFQLTSSAVLDVSFAHPNNGVTHQVTTQDTNGYKSASRKLMNRTLNGPTYTEWAEPVVSADLALAQIRELAAADGWEYAYVPAKPRQGTKVSSVLDVLGHGESLIAVTGAEPDFHPNALGMLGGIDVSGGRTVRRDLPNITGDHTIMTVAQWNGQPTPSGYEIIIDGVTDGRKNIAVNTGRSGTPFGFASAPNMTYSADHSPHVITLQCSEDTDYLMVDGQFANWRAETSDTLGGITIGSTPAGGSNFTGIVGPVLVRKDTDRAAIARMENMLRTLAGARPMHNLDNRVVAYTQSESGRDAFAYGDIDRVHPTGIQSITKLMTWLLARDLFTEAEWNGTALAYEAGDDDGGNIWGVGDTLLIREWAWAAIGPSFNAPNEVIARAGGLKLLDGEAGDPHQAFIDEMNRRSREWWGVAAFTLTYAAARLSARQTLDLLRRAYGDPVLLDLMRTERASVNVTGPNERTLTWGHTIPSHCPFPFPEWDGGKTGSGNGYGHVATAWISPIDGERYFTVVLNVDISEADVRYGELKKAVEASHGAAKPTGLYQFAMPEGDGLAQTGFYDLTGDVTSTGGALTVERQGDWCKLSIASLQVAGTGSIGSGVIPAQLRPRNFEYGVATESNGKAYEVRISTSGTVYFYGDGPSGELRGSLWYRTRREWV